METLVDKVCSICSCALVDKAALIMDTFTDMDLDDMAYCPGPEEHRPTQRHAYGKREYVLFKAAEDGCLSCVKWLIEQEGVDPNSRSENMGYTVVGFADWGLQRHQKMARAL